MVLEKRVQYKQNKKMDKTDFNETEKKQCLGCGSVGSARFWLPGSRSAKICGSTDPDPKGKKSTKN